MSFSTNKPEYVRLIICDSSGGRRCKVVPKDVYDSNIKGTHMVMAIMVMAISLAWHQGVGVGRSCVGV